MIHLPVLRWGSTYESLEVDEVVHFLTGEPVAKVSQANAGIVRRDLKKAHKARNVLRDIPVQELIERCKKAADLFLEAELPMGDGTQTPEQFAHAQSSSTGLPVHMCHANMKKNHFVLKNMDRMLDALSRGLNLDVLTRGYGIEDRGVVISYQAQTNALGLVLPSNSPGVHTLWLPVIPMQIGLLLKPGSREPWTCYRMQAAMEQAGIPAEAFGIYPGKPEVGAALLSGCSRSMIFGGPATIEQYKGNDGVQVHGPGYAKILIGDDVVDDWEQYLDLMVESVLINSGRSCINCSGIWASRHTKEIAQAVAERIGPVEVKPPDDPDAELAAFTIKEQAVGTWDMIEQDLKQDGVTHMTADYGPRLDERERCAYLRPTVVHCASPELDIAKKEFMFPFVTVVECPQDEMLGKIDYTLVGTAITGNAAWQRELTDATHIDRLNLGPIPTNRLSWLQPHEGNIIDFLFKGRALQIPEDQVAALSGK